MSIRAAPDATAAAAPDTSAAPHLASLEIGIWPEFDRPAMVLVILKGELPADAALPATFTLRIPKTSGEPSAVASQPTADSPLVNSKFEVAEVGDSLQLSITTEDRFFQVEFYDALPVDKETRNYTYVWPGDASADRLVVRLQEPLGSTVISTEPKLPSVLTSADGLVYRSAELGTLEAGKQVTITASYHKTDPRTTIEILNASAPQKPDSSKTPPTWLIVTGAATLLAAGVLVLQRTLPGRIRLPARAAPTQASAPGSKKRFCTKCGNRLGARDRYCSSCGFALPR